MRKRDNIHKLGHGDLTLRFGWPLGHQGHVWALIFLSSYERDGFGLLMIFLAKIIETPWERNWRDAWDDWTRDGFKVTLEMMEHLGIFIKNGDVDEDLHLHIEMVMHEHFLIFFLFFFFFFLFLLFSLSFLSLVHLVLHFEERERESREWMGVWESEWEWASYAGFTL